MKKTRSQQTLTGRNKNAFCWLIGERTKLQRRGHNCNATELASLYSVFPGLLGQCNSATYPTRWTCSDHLTRNVSAARNNEALEPHISIGPFIRGKIRRVLHIYTSMSYLIRRVLAKPRLVLDEMCRLCGKFASYLRRVLFILCKTRLIFPRIMALMSPLFCFILVVIYYV